MGVVYRVFDRRLGRDVALKLLRHADAGDLYRFKREFRSIAGIIHPNLVTLHELHTTGDEWFFTMDLVEGVPFIEWVRAAQVPEETVPDAAADEATRTAAPVRPAPPKAPRPAIESRLDLGRLRTALPQLVDGVLALHVAGKLHRDLKPSNVLVGKDGRVV